MVLSLFVTEGMCWSGVCQGHDTCSVPFRPPTYKGDNPINLNSSIQYVSFTFTSDSGLAVRHGRCYRARGLRCVFLMTSTHGRFLVLGVDTLQGSDALNSWMETVYGIYPWVISLVMGNLLGDVFV